MIWLLIVFVVIILILLLLVQQEHERLRDPYVASFVHEPPNTWRWHWARFKLRLTGGIPPRS